MPWSLPSIGRGDSKVFSVNFENDYFNEFHLQFLPSWYIFLP